MYYNTCTSNTKYTFRKNVLNILFEVHLREYLSECRKWFGKLDVDQVLCILSATMDPFVRIKYFNEFVWILCKASQQDYISINATSKSYQ